MMEDHWDTRQEYIKMGNELTSLANKQEKEKKRQEKEQKEKESKKIMEGYQVNTSSQSSEVMPSFVPTKKETNPPTRNTLEEPRERLMNHQDNPSFKINQDNPSFKINQDKPALGMNQGKQNFQNQMPSMSVGRPLGQNNNPFMNQNHRF